jgi:hypothetical protein
VCFVKTLASLAVFSFPRRFILFSALLCLSCCHLLAQAPNSNYTADMPSVDRVKAEIKGSDSTDTLARQVAVFNYLQQYIQRIKYNRTVRGAYTPEEQKLLSAYSLASYQISQDYAKTHTPEQTKAFETRHNQYEMDSAFYQDWSKRLIGPQSAAAYRSMEVEGAQRQQAHNDAINRQNKEAAAATASGGTSSLSNDPTSVTTRRCLELGGSSMACLGKGMGAGLMGLIGVNSMDDITGATGPTGVVLDGLYKASSGASLSFNDTAASSVDCGKAIPAGYSYTIERQPGRVRVRVASKPTPYTLTMRPDGGLTGPGPLDITNSIIIGYNTVTTTQMVNGQRAFLDQCNGPCQTTRSEPIYGPKTEHCSIGSLAAPPKPQPDSGQPSGADAGVLGLMTEFANTGEMNINAEGGLRVVGKYASGPLLLDFSSTSVVLDCGLAHVRDTYAVENAPGNFIIHIANSGGPINLTVFSDNTLQGTGSATINGRLVASMTGENITFRPHAETCPLATFRPSKASPATAPVSVATSAPATPTAPTGSSSVTPRTATPSSPASSTTPSTSSGPRASMRVIITSQFPSGTNPLAGQKVFVMREPMDAVLRKLNVSVPPNTSPGKAMQLLAATCRSTDCHPIFQGMAQYNVTTASLDASGKATLNATAATGTYFFYAIVRTPQGSLMWDIPANLAAGDNSVTLTQTNAELIQ